MECGQGTAKGFLLQSCPEDSRWDNQFKRLLFMNARGALLRAGYGRVNSTRDTELAIKVVSRVKLVPSRWPEAVWVSSALAGSCQAL
jgi:hypothetical protein